MRFDNGYYDLHIDHHLSVLVRHRQLPDSVQKLINSVNSADLWIVKHQDQALQIYAQSTGLSTPVAQQVLNKRPKPSPVYALNSEVITSQQQIADLFKQEQLIPVHINIQHSVWSAQ